MHIDTKLVHIGQEPEPVTGDIVPAIHLSTTYERRMQDPPHYFYGRTENPTREGLERCLASLEDAAYAAVFASGQAAAATALSLVPPGRHVVSTDDIYTGTSALFALAGRRGNPVHCVDLSDPVQRDEALSRPELGMIWVETPTNPLLKIVDIGEVARRVRGRNVLVVVDNTFASPVLQQPLPLGADISLYSTTKSIAGHSDVLGGALVYHDSTLDQAIREYRQAMGNVPSPLDCFLVHRGVKTLSLRVARQVQTARLLADLLRARAEVGRVHYPGLAEHPHHRVAARQMAQPGSIISFEYLGDVEKLLDRVRLFSCGVSLGSVRSLIECPAIMTHRPLPADVRARRGISDSLIRLSVGIEDPHDLLADLGEALAA